MAKGEKRRVVEKPKPRILKPTIGARKRYVKLMLTLLAAFLTFGGPTYAMYILKRFVLPYVLLVLFGLASFTAGIVLFAYLFKGERETEAST